MPAIMDPKNKSLLVKFIDVALALIGAAIAAYICLENSKDGYAYAYFYEDAANYISAEYLFWGWLELGDTFGMTLPNVIFPLLFVTLLIKLKAFQRLGGSPTYSYLSYISVFFLLHEGTQLRISCALALALLSCIGVMRKQWFVAFVLCCMAFGFHITSPLLPIAFAACYYYKSVRKLSWYFLATGVVLYVFNISILQLINQLTDVVGGRYVSYSDSLLDDQNSSGLAFVYAFLLCGLLAFINFWGRHKLKNLPATSPALLATSVYGCALLFWLHETTAIASRLSDVLVICIVPLLAMVIARVSFVFQLLSVLLLCSFFGLRLMQLFF
jgi:hypothetical protein